MLSSFQLEFTMQHAPHLGKSPEEQAWEIAGTIDDYTDFWFQETAEITVHDDHIYVLADLGAECIPDDYDDAVVKEHATDWMEIQLPEWAAKLALIDVHVKPTLYPFGLNYDSELQSETGFFGETGLRWSDFATI